jgi:hypothetical protein
MREEEKEEKKRKLLSLKNHPVQLGCTGNFSVQHVARSI